MPQPIKPSTMSPSDWRLWCCCHPKVTPPPSSPRARNNYSLEEFNPRNRMSASTAYRLPRPPAPPDTIAESNTILTVPARKVQFSKPRPSRVQRNGAPVTGERESRQQRRTTTLFPSSPLVDHQRFPLRPKETSKGKGKQPMPKFIRHDTEPGQHWWQVGRGLLERNGKDGGSREDRLSPAGRI